MELQMHHILINYADQAYVTVQTGCYYITLPAQSIHLHEKSIAGPTERPKSFSFFGSQGSDQRFSMKMMFATYLRPEAACLNCYYPEGGEHASLFKVFGTA